METQEKIKGPKYKNNCAIIIKHCTMKKNGHIPTFFNLFLLSQVIKLLYGKEGRNIEYEELQEDYTNGQTRKNLRFAKETRRQDY